MTTRRPSVVGQPERGVTPRRPCVPWTIRSHGFGGSTRTPAVPALATCKAEIEALHAFFVEWYTGTTDDDAIARLEGALAPDFEMVTPDGTRLDRDSVLENVRGSYERDEPGTFAIEIRNVEVIAQLEGHALVRYEEWQDVDQETTGRVSTILFRDATAAPGGLEWVDLHETWLEAGSDGDG